MRVRCLRVARVLQSYLDGEADPPTAAAVAAHLEECRRCGLEASTYAAIKTAIAANGAHSPGAVDPAALTRLRGLRRAARRGPLGRGLVSRRDGSLDLLVVGGGTAGIVGATTAASLGARVALVERDRTGGECLWTGCVPSKALLAAGSAAAQAREAFRLGVSVGEVRVDFPAVMQHVHEAIARIEPVDSPDALRRAGVEVVAAEAVFTSPRSADAGGRTLAFGQALLATGSAPVVPDVPGLRAAAPLTNETLWALRRLPGRLVVLGAGPVGCELAQAFARLGAQVTLVESAPRLLAREDPQAAALVRAALEDDGVRVLTSARLAAVDGDPGHPGVVGVDAAGGEQQLGYDALLVAAGRRPATAGLGLVAAGVQVDADGAVRVDAHLRTTNPRVWAAGDLTAHPRLTHLAAVHGSLAATNAVLGLRRRVDSTAVPRVTFTDPEVAAVGASTWADDGPAARTVTRDHDHVDRAVAEDRRDGFTRLALDRRHRVVGATVVGPRAGESLAELVLATRKGLSTSDLAGTTHAYPTYADGAWNAAIDDVRGRLRSPGVRHALRAAAGVRRAWLSYRD